jgi:hypothetical protein
VMGKHLFSHHPGLGASDVESQSLVMWNMSFRHDQPSMMDSVVFLYVGIPNCVTNIKKGDGTPK